MRKRAFDVIISSLALLFFSPLLVITCIIMKISSPGPLFSKNKKIGMRGVPFDLYHFRTPFFNRKNTVDNTSDIKDALQPAFTPLGKKRSHFKIDLLPELFNVLKGDMSLVGPRPETPSFIEIFQEDFEIILRIKPGMVGLLSTSGNIESKTLSSKNAEPSYKQPSAPKNILHAKRYLQNHSFLLDLKILFSYLTRSFLSAPSPFRYRKTSKEKQLREEIFDAKGTIIFIVHLIAVFFCHQSAFWLRFDGEIPSETLNLSLKLAPTVLSVQMTFLYFFGMNRGLWRYSGLRDFLNITVTVIFSEIFIWGTISLFQWQGYPRSIYFIDAILLIVALSMLRCSKQVYTILTQTGVGARRVLIIGAGDAGEMIARDMKQNRRQQCLPVGFIDDDPEKRTKKIHNIPVIGNSSEMAMAVSKLFPDEVLIAIPSGTPIEIKKIIHHCQSLQLPIKTLPDLSAILNGKAIATDIRPLDIEELLGREEIRIHDPKIEESIREKNVLITGAGGSIGSELCRQVASFKPRQLILVERHENNLYQLEITLGEQFPGLPLKLYLADILDTEKINQIFFETRPQIVFHAAAHKHVPMMERHPLEAVRNNIIGTYRLMMASDRHGVSEFVLISTDKAVSPSSVMGASKRVAEMMVRYFDPTSRTKMVSVRFGNVLESAGSVVPLFRAQIKKGGPLWITHPEVERYFISIHEAVQLVLQASVLGHGGEIFVLDMGKSIKIMDLAKTMITLSGFSPGLEIPIKIIGLRPGEKLSEKLFEAGEKVIQTHHKKIRLAQNGSIHSNLPAFIKRFAAMNSNTDPKKIKTVLKELIPSYQMDPSSKAAIIPAQTSDNPPQHSHKALNKKQPA